jgi:hypothetical protein
VANYNKTTSQEAFIIEKQKEGYRGIEIVELLLQNYSDMTRNEAVELIARIATELELERGAKKKAIEIKINPGFKILIKE